MAAGHEGGAGRLLASIHSYNPRGDEVVKYLSLARAKRHLREAVAEHPDRINPMAHGACRYTDTRDPSIHCIAGEIISRAGLPLSFLREGCGFAPNDGMYEWPDKLGRAYVDKGYMTKETVFFLGTIQKHFDRAALRNIDRTWKDALRRTKTIEVPGFV